MYTSYSQVPMEDFEDIRASRLLLDHDLVNVSGQRGKPLAFAMGSVARPGLQPRVVICVTDVAQYYRGVQVGLLLVVRVGR